MQEERLYRIDAITRADAQKRRLASPYTATLTWAEKNYSADSTQQLYAVMTRKITPLMAYVRSLLPQCASNADLCRALSLSDTTCRRLDEGSSIPDPKTVAHLQEKLNLNEAQAQKLRDLAYLTPTRFGAVMLCNFVFGVYDPVHINTALRRWLLENDPLYSAKDVAYYDAFWGDWRDWCILLTEKKKPMTEKESEIKESLDNCNRIREEMLTEDEHTALMLFILRHLFATHQRPGHFYRKCTLSDGAWAALDDPEIRPSEKTLWKVAAGMRLSPRKAQSLFEKAYCRTKEEGRK